ncbi:MAG: phytanoyl-CoA dioxygenase family protein, partial [Candidatus Omnitrophica bacterium]|nr:phytanoyl-CoA dioxygenase family protein [Candidatus Omnitrophota bacterium]
PYWHSVEGTDIVTVWLALDDSTVQNGCMKVIPTSHEGYPDLEMRKTDGRDLLGVEVQVTAELEERAAPVELKAGDLSIHDSFILHGSDANTSDRRRAGYTMRYANANTVHVDLAEHWVPVYQVRGTAKNATGEYIDLRPTHSADG